MISPDASVILINNGATNEMLEDGDPDALEELAARLWATRTAFWWTLREPGEGTKESAP